MSLSLPEAQRFARQIALPEIGPAGQARLRASAVAWVRTSGSDSAGEVASEYLSAAGLGRVVPVASSEEGEGWLRTLGSFQAVMRFNFDDDGLLHATVRLGLPVVMGRALRERVDLISFRRHGPCPHAALDVPLQSSAVSDRQPGAAASVLGALAAAELLWVLVAPAEGPRARLLRLPLDGGEPHATALAWQPECFICGGQGREASFDSRGGAS